MTINELTFNEVMLLYTIKIAALQKKDVVVLMKLQKHYSFLFDKNVDYLEEMYRLYNLHSKR